VKLWTGFIWLKITYPWKTPVNIAVKIEVLEAVGDYEEYCLLGNDAV
jgi:hypothetical protein